MYYRTVLYSDYSASFAAQKEHDPALQYKVYQATYNLNNVGKDSCILDIGCGKGEWLSWLYEQSYHQLHGVDFSPSDICIAQKVVPNCHLAHGDAISYLKQRQTHFDLIHAKDVIEHMTKDEFVTFLQVALASLKPGGKLWLRSFNAQAPLSTATRYGDFTHETGHTPSSLAQCLRATGYQKIHVHGFHYCSNSLNGRVRSILSWPIKQLARLILKLRHGGSTSTEIDLFAAEPDLHAEAVKF
jgi:cyclopropane fatty-acyl-phospholipid synthase-like methyltransferase